LSWRLRLAEDRHGRERARDHERSRDEMGGREAWMPHRDVSQGCEPCFSAGFSPLYGKKKGASALVSLAPAAGLIEWGVTKIRWRDYGR
jgi:hypothetical protein